MKAKTKIYLVDLEKCAGERKLITIKMQICSCKAPGWQTGVPRISLLNKISNNIEGYQYWVLLANGRQVEFHYSVTILDSGG